MKKKKIRPTKKDHATKTPNERKRYRELLDIPEKAINETIPYGPEENNDDLNMDKIITETAKDSDYQKLKKIDTTNEEKVKPYESFSTKFSKYAKDIIIGVILFGIVGGAVTIVWGQQKELGKISANIDSVLKDIDDMYKKYDQINNDKIKTIEITTEIKKDLEFVKLRLDKIEN